MGFYQDYNVDDKGRVTPLESATGGWAKKQPNVNFFDDALEWLLTIGLKDAGFDDDEDWPEFVERVLPRFFSVYYLNPEEALCVLTGVSLYLACYLFDWKGEMFFTMRPDFGHLTILNDFDEPPINLYEDRLSQRLLDVAGVEVEAISRAIRNREILSDGRAEASFDEWISMFKRRGFDLSHIPYKYISGTISEDRNNLDESKSTKTITEERHDRMIECAKRLWATPGPDGRYLTSTKICNHPEMIESARFKNGRHMKPEAVWRVVKHLNPDKSPGRR
ncbi:MAG: hypothetical protein JEZ11_07145 [Desulfobacterales bacterium]|nr:hypothetical protein [Desulfobacterales bacterium]